MAAQMLEKKFLVQNMNLLLKHNRFPLAMPVVPDSLRDSRLVEAIQKSITDTFSHLYFGAIVVKHHMHYKLVKGQFKMANVGMHSRMSQMVSQERSSHNVQSNI
jgi:hypothetical protein